MAVVQPSNNQYLALPFPLFLKTYPFIRQKRLFCTAKPMPLQFISILFHLTRGLFCTAKPMPLQCKSAAIAF